MKIEETQIADAIEEKYNKGLLFSPENEEDVEFIETILSQQESGKEIQVAGGTHEEVLEDLIKVPAHVWIRRWIWFVGISALALYTPLVTLIGTPWVATLTAIGISAVLLKILKVG